MASIIGGGAAALLYERSGSWSAGFYGSALMALVAAGLAFGLRASRSTKPVGVCRPLPPGSAQPLGSPKGLRYRCSVTGVPSAADIPLVVSTGLQPCHDPGSDREISP